MYVYICGGNTVIHMQYIHNITNHAGFQAFTAKNVDSSHCLFFVKKIIHKSQIYRVNIITRAGHEILKKRPRGG